jgi:23S rRNA (pseudouridine1915-N3)-methyltransferase
MKFYLIAVGQRVPDWIKQGYQEFAKRLPSEQRINLIEIDTSKRHKNSDCMRLLEREARSISAAIPRSSLVIALDVNGQQWSTQRLTQQIIDWQQQGRDVTFLIGGPDGLAPECIARAQLVWSLSPLTFPHALVRVMVAEQLYRAWSIINDHPYHRN